jgi:hypothetical protein
MRLLVELSTVVTFYTGGVTILNQRFCLLVLATKQVPGFEVLTAVVMKSSGLLGYNVV